MVTLQSRSRCHHLHIKAFIEFLLSKKKKKNFTSFGQPTRLISMCQQGASVVMVQVFPTYIQKHVQNFYLSICQQDGPVFIVYLIISSKVDPSSWFRYVQFTYTSTY